MTAVTVPASGTAAAAPAVRGARSPGRDEAVDALALLALTIIGIVGFRAAYGGHGYLVAGAAGVAPRRAAQPRRPAGPAAAARRRRRGRARVPAARRRGQPDGHGEPAERCRVGRRRGGLRLAAAADHRAAGRPHRRPAGAALPARPVQRRGRARARPPHHADRAARRAAPAVVVALSILFGAAQPTAAVLQGAGFAGRRPRLGRRAPAARQRASAPPSAGSGPGSGSARRSRCSPWPAPAPSSSARACPARTRTSGSCSTSCRRST